MAEQQISDVMPELFKDLAAAGTINTIPNKRSSRRDLTENPFWMREVLPVLMDLKPYRLRKGRRQRGRGRWHDPVPPWFDVSGRAPEGCVRLDISIPEQGSEIIDLALATLLRDSGYFRMSNILWRILPIEELAAEIETLFGSRTIWRMLTPQNVKRIAIDVPYSEKKDAMALGARWDAGERLWWVSAVDYCPAIVARGWGPEWRIYQT